MRASGVRDAPFRFGVNLLTSCPAKEWSAKCRRAEELGYDVILVPDHLGMPAPFPALVAAARATERPRVGTFVLNARFYNPALLAREVATTDALTGGRLELGLGTGYVRAEHERTGLPFGSPGERVAHLRRTVEEPERLLGDEEHQPRPVQDPGVPLLIGASGDRMLELAARHADTAAFTGGRTARDGRLTLLSADELDARVARYRELAAGRKEPAELNLLFQTVAVTDDAEAAVQPFVGHMPQLTAREVLELPVATGRDGRGGHRAGAGAARAVRVLLRDRAGAAHGGVRAGDRGAARGLRPRRTGTPGPHAGISARSVRRVCWDRRMDDLRIRPAGPEDLDAVLAFWKTAAEGTSISDDREGVERLVARDPGALILAERDGELAGTVIAGFDGWRCHLYRLAVHPDRRRRGIGSALLAAAEDRFAGLGGRRGDAMVLERNERGQHAWRAAGYAPEEQWRRWVKHLQGLPGPCGPTEGQ